MKIETEAATLTQVTTEYLSPAQAAVRLGVNHKTVYGYLSTGKLEGLYIDPWFISIPAQSVESLRRRCFNSCLRCGSPFFTRQLNREYCTRRCMTRAWKDREALKVARKSARKEYLRVYGQTNRDRLNQRRKELRVIRRNAK